MFKMYQPLRVLTALLVLTVGCQPPEPVPPPDLVVQSTRIVDVASGELIGPVDISVRDGRIASIDDPGEGPPADSATQFVEASGTYAIPGLHDMHSHLWNRETLAETYLAYGITSVRDMGGALDNWAAWEAEADSIPVPRSFNGAAILDGVQSVSFFFTQAQDSAQARERVDELTASGADFIKVYSRLTNEAFFTAAARARELDVGFAGHVPYGVPVSRALDEGMRSIEHFTGVALECSEAEGELRQRILDRLAPFQADSVDPQLLSEPLTDAYTMERWEALDGYDPANCPELMERVLDGDVWITPTLVVTAYGFEEKTARVEPFLSEWPEWMHGMMRPQPSEAETQERIDALRGMFSDLDAAGARWLAGADAPNPGSTPGVALHYELELLVDFGLTPLEALQAATLHAAEFVGRSDTSGSIETGKDADIVLLGESPLDDIRSTRDVRGVILRGRVLEQR